MKPVHIGNVHEIYDISSEHCVIVKTDRISACGALLPVQIKNKGIILNEISNFWFGKTRNIIKNHILEDKNENMPIFFQDERFKCRTVMVEKLDILPFEIIVRGYMFGRLWKAYQKHEKICGILLTDDYQLTQKLDHPVITPTTKRDNERDENVSISYVESHLGSELTKKIIDVSLDLYTICSQYALSKDLIIADTKFEFGLNKQGELVLADEIFTPDSSRYWDVSDYKTNVLPKSYDKQIIRDWLLNHKKDNKLQLDKIPEDILYQTEKVYQECKNRLMQ